MSFLKDFKDELSQAVNELVNIDENVDTADNTEKEEKEEMAKTKKKKNVSGNGEPVVKEVDKNEEVNTLDKEIMSEIENDFDREMLNELFGNENGEEYDTKAEDESDNNIDMNILDDNLYSEPSVNKEKDDNSVINNMNVEDVVTENIDISQYMEDEQSKKDMDSESDDNTIIKELARNIQSKINDDKLEEMMADDKESKKAALRGMRREEKIEQNDETEQVSSLATEEVTEVTKGTMIDGNIVSEGSMNVYGKIKGNVACRGKLVVCGTIVGSSRGAEIFTNNAKIDGDVTSDSSIKIGNGTVIIGNIYGTSAVIAGAVQGDIDVHGPVIIDGTAVIQGNIRSRSVQINNGAALEGMVSQCYADIDYAALFDKTFSK